MVVVRNGIEQALSDRVFRSMFEERKRVFVDLLGWDIPVLAGRYEIDQFDDDEATYIVVTDGTGEHCGSARLLRTDRPHILDTIFPTCATIFRQQDRGSARLRAFVWREGSRLASDLRPAIVLCPLWSNMPFAMASRHIPALLSGHGFSRSSHLVGNVSRSVCRAAPAAACLRCG